MLKALLFPFRLLYLILLSLARIIRFFFGAGIRTLRYTAGSAVVLALGVILGVFMGKKYDGGKLPSVKKRAAAPKEDKGPQP